MFKRNHRVRRIILSCVFFGLSTTVAQAAIPLLLYETAYVVAEAIPLLISTCGQLISILSKRPAVVDAQSLTRTIAQPVPIKIVNHTERVCLPTLTVHINTQQEQAYNRIVYFVIQDFVDKKALSAEQGQLASRFMGQAFRTSLHEKQQNQVLYTRVTEAIARHEIDQKIHDDPVFAAEYQQAFNFIYSRILDLLRYQEPSNNALKLETIFDLNHIHLPGLAGQIFSNFREGLNDLCFDKDGNLKESLPNQKIADLVALFVKTCSNEQKGYLKHLTDAQASGALGLENSIQKASQETFCKPQNNPFVQRPELHKAIINNASNQQLRKLIACCKEGDFKHAHSYAHTKIAKQVYKGLYHNAYHSYGVPRFYDNDPLVKNLTDQDKNDLAKDADIRRGFIKELETRLQIKEELMRGCAIPEKHSDAVTQAVYGAIPYAGKHDEFLKYCNQFCSSSPEHKEICTAFFSPDGILKIWDTHKGIFDDLDKPIGLNLPQNKTLRLQVNQLLLVNPTQANTPALKQVYKYCTAATHATKSAQDMYCAMVENNLLALYGSQEHALLLSCPDCTHVYTTPEQNAVQDLIMQRFVQATQTTDPVKKAIFTNHIAPLLQRAHRYNHEGHGLIANAVIIAADNHDQIKHIGQGLGSTAVVVLAYKFFEQAKNRLQRQSNQQPIGQKQSANASDPEDPEKRTRNNKDLTHKQDKEDAEKLGFKIDKDPPFNTHGKKAFRKGNRWISGDRDGHKGGRWKMFNEKGKRLGTFDKDLNIIAT